MGRSLGAVVALSGLLLLAGPTAFLLWARSMFTVGLNLSALVYVAAVALIGALGVAVGLRLLLKKPV